MLNSINFLKLSLISVIFLIIFVPTYTTDAHDLRTPNGSPVPHAHDTDTGWEGIQYGITAYYTVEEWTAWSDDFYENYYDSRVDRANKAYNCYAYAWAHARQNNPASWCNISSENIYIIDGSYEAVPQSQATHVSYGSVGHALRVISGNTMISKWGKLPVYIHQLITGDPYPATASDVSFYRLAPPPPPPPPLASVTISGTLTLYAEMTGQWTATTVDGYDPFTYNWEIMYTEGGGYLESYAEVLKMYENREREQNGKDDPIIRLPVSNEWVPIGTNSPYFERTHNPYDLRDFYLRCKVTDGSSTTKTSNSLFVDVVSYPPPQASIVQADNPETTPIVKSYDAMTQKTDAVTAEENLPDNFALEQNYPNPFNPTTNITYAIPEGGFVTLKVYDMLGREAAALVNETKPAGRYTVEFNASDLPSGTYVYKLTSGNYSVVKKMSLVK